jgi:hypothetical protein
MSFPEALVVAAFLAALIMVLSWAHKRQPTVEEKMVIVNMGTRILALEKEVAYLRRSLVKEAAGAAYLAAVRDLHAMEGEIGRDVAERAGKNLMEAWDHMQRIYEKAEGEQP